MKSLLAVLTVGVLCAASASVEAHPKYVPQCRQVSPGFSIQSSHYQEPDGTYNSYADYIRDLNGTPCGIACDAPWRHVTYFASPPHYICH